MKTLFLDIETLPADEASRDALAYLYERKQEKSRKKAGTKEGAAVPATADAEDFEQFLLRTSFDGASRPWGPLHFRLGFFIIGSVYHEEPISLQPRLWSQKRGPLHPAPSRPRRRPYRRCPFVPRRSGGLGTSRIKSRCLMCCCPAPTPVGGQTASG